MAAPQGDMPQDSGIDASSRTSPIPVLGDGFSEPTSSTAPASTIVDTEQAPNVTEKDPKTSKRRFWNLGKKKEDIKTTKPESGNTLTSPTAMASIQSPSSAHPTSPHYAYAPPSSPGRIRSASPASSQIFERNVQEDGLISMASPATPSHITTENHIPPALDASTEAITDDHLDPDNVEIVTLASHQPAALTVTGAPLSEVQSPTIPIWPDEFNPHPTEAEDAVSNYATLDATDVRRLSFISFADVVHGEQTGDHSSLRESIPSMASPTMGGPRSPSPLRSPISPPLSGSQSPLHKGFGDISPGRSSRAGHSPPTGAELSIETMRQALRKTGSGDLSGARSQPMSATTEEAMLGNPFK